MDNTIYARRVYNEKYLNYFDIPSSKKYYRGDYFYQTKLSVDETLNYYFKKLFADDDFDEDFKKYAKQNSKIRFIYLMVSDISCQLYYEHYYEEDRGLWTDDLGTYVRREMVYGGLKPSNGRLSTRIVDPFLSYLGLNTNTNTLSAPQGGIDVLMDEDWENRVYSRMVDDEDERWVEKYGYHIAKVSDQRIDRLFYPVLLIKCTYENKTYFSYVNASTLDYSFSGKLSDKNILEQHVKYAKEGDVCEQYHVGLSYIDGRNYGIKNIKEGLYWLKSAAENRHPVACCYLGYLYYNGISVEKDYNSAFNYYLRAYEYDEKGLFKSDTPDHSRAVIRYSLAICEEYGYGTNAYYEGAAALYVRALKLGYEMVYEHVEESLNDDNREKLAAFGKYFSDLNDLRSMTIAYKACLRAIKLGDTSPIMVNLGELYVVGIKGFLPSNPEEGAKWLKKAADLGYNRAYYPLAVLCSNYTNISKLIDKKALYYYELVYEKYSQSRNWYNAVLYCARHYSFEYDDAEAIDKALKYLVEASQWEYRMVTSDDGKISYVLENMYQDLLKKGNSVLTAYGCQKIYDEYNIYTLCSSSTIMKSFIEKNNRPKNLYIFYRHTILEHCIFEGSAIPNLKVAAEKGYEPAIFTLACHYEFGEYGIEKDYEKAIELYNSLLSKNSNAQNIKAKELYAKALSIGDFDENMSLKDLATKRLALFKKGLFGRIKKIRS